MSDTYEDEFEKWLQNSPDAKSTDVTEEDDSNDESQHYREYQVKSVCNYDSQFESETLQNHLLCAHHNVSSGSIIDHAPILVDDDDDLFQIKKQKYEDEPPILEPIPNQLQSYRVSTVRSPQFSPQICPRNYSRSNQVPFRKHFLKEVKTCGVVDNVSLVTFETSDMSSERSSLMSRSSKSDNIFDHLISENYEDCPPPLIPSPEILQIHCESQSSMTKLPNYSPELCAMEADSTSEINGGKVLSVLRSKRMSKNSAHEVLVECDSTCMLAASPLIVSPASVSNGEMEETNDSTEVAHEDVQSENCDYKSNKSGNVFIGTTKSEEQSSLVQTAFQNCLVNDICSDKVEAKCFDSNSVIAEELNSLPYPPQLDIITLSGSDCKLSVPVKNNSQNIVSEFSIEPPILSAVSPQIVRYNTRFRNTRHTVDSPDTFCRSSKRTHNTACLQTNIQSVCDLSTPPTLTRVSETFMRNTSRSKCSNTVSQHSKIECLSCCHDKCLSRKRRRRCRSLPVVDVKRHYNNLSKTLHSFVVGTSELSDLQSHMHRLLYELFPQLKTELDAMSPESFKFQNLLSDLIKLLEQPVVQESSSPPPLISCQDIKPNFIYECPRLVSITSELNYTFQNISQDLPSHLLSTSDLQTVADFAKHVQSDANSSNQTSLSALSSSNNKYCQEKPQHNVKMQNISQDDDKDLVIPLSRLNVKDLEELLIPSKVLLCKDPGVLLERFLQLSCRTLQLLLPDLPVSVCSELAKCPHHLVAFINKVIAANSQR